MTKKKKALITSPSAFFRPFLLHLGCEVDVWDPSKPNEDVDLLVFADGPCVTPTFIGQRINAKAPKKDYSIRRDWRERKMFSEFDSTVPRFGFGRGAVMLNLLHGGNMVQHTDRHQMVHDLYFPKTNTTLENCPSSHTQMMIPSKVIDYTLIALADSSNNRFYENESVCITKNNWADYEIIYYDSTASLCWQPSIFTMESYPLKATLLGYLDSLLKTGDIKA